MPKADWHHLYDLKRWKATRLFQLGTHPMCCLCEEAGKLTPACIVDHIVPHKGDVDLFFDPNNLQSLCKSCHDGVKQKLERTGIRKGSDLQGQPLDKNHHWNKA